MRARALLVAGALALAACSSSKPTLTADAGRDVGADSGSDAAASTPGLTCQQIRLCVFSAPCTDEACIADCASMGSPSARATFEALRACTEQACTPKDVNCACTEQCLANGSCLQEADACLGTATVDDICDQLCA